jgi:hypothetical protein
VYDCVHLYDYSVKHASNRWLTDIDAKCQLEAFARLNGCKSARHNVLMLNAIECINALQFN